MSLENPNHIEVRLMRENVRLTVNECAEMFRVNRRTWQHWESGRNKAPSNVIDELDALNTIKDQRLGEIFAEIEEKQQDELIFSLPWYAEFDEFKTHYPKSACIATWRLYQSVAAQLMHELCTVTLVPEHVEIDPDSHLYKWLTRTTQSDIELQAFEEQYPVLSYCEEHNPELDVIYMVRNNQISVSDLSDTQLAMCALALDAPLLLPAGMYEKELDHIKQTLTDRQRDALTRFSEPR